MFMETGKHFYEWLITYQSEKKCIGNWSKNLCIFTFFIVFFNESSNQEHNLLLDYAFEPFTYGIFVVKIVCQAFLPLLLTWAWASLAIFYLDQFQMVTVCSAQHHCHFGKRDNSLVYVEW